MKRLIIFILLVLFLFSLSVEGQNSRNIATQLRTARRFERSKNYKQALSIYQSLHEQYPDNNSVFDGIQRCYIALKMYDKQIAMLQEKLKKQPNNINIYEWLGTALYRSGQKEEGEKYWEKIIDMNPNDMDRYKMVANLYYSNGMYDEAVQTYETARDVKGDQNLFSRELARLYERMMNFSQAIEEYIKYMKTEKRRTTYVSGKIIRLCEQENIWDQAIIIIKNELDKPSVYKELHKLLGDIYLRTGQSKLGLEQYILYEKKTKSMGKDLFWFGERCIDEGEDSVSVQAFNEIINNYPKSPYKNRAMLKKGLALTNLRRYDAALDSYTALINQGNSHNHYGAKAFLGIGDIYLHNLKETDKALEYFKKLRDNFRHGEYRFLSHFRIAEVYFVKNQLNKAQEELLKVKNLTNEKSIQEKVLYEVAFLELLQGNMDKAGKQFSDMLKEYPNGKYVNDVLRWSLFLNENKQNQEMTTQYLTALLHQKQMKYDAAIEGFNEIINSSTDSTLVDDAVMQVAEVYREKLDYEQAINHYKQLIEEYPNSELCPEAQMRIGDIYGIILDRYKASKSAYEKVILDYPESLQADLVRKKIQKLSGKIQQSNNEENKIN